MKLFGHAADPIPHEKPDPENPQKGVTQGNPEPGVTKSPSDFSSKSDKENRREVGRGIGKGAHPGADGSSTQEKVFKRAAFFEVYNAYKGNNGRIDDDDRHF